MFRPNVMHPGCAGWRRLVAPVAGLLVVLAGTLLRAAGDAPAAPTLEDIKGDLKAIKRDNNAVAGQGASLSKVTLPGLRAAPDSSAAAPAQSAPAADATSDAPPTAGSNWLLDGVGLQTQARPNGRPEAAGAKQNDVPLTDLSDPAFMLRLYLAQTNEHSAAEEAHSREAATDQSRPAGVGSFDTFLSQWVSKRDPALRGLIQAASPTPADPNASGPTTVPPLSAPETPGAPAPNPFLAAFNLDLPRSAPLEAAAAAPNPPAAPPTMAPPPAAADSPARVPPAPPPNPAEDKKYFPQLNRF